VRDTFHDFAVQHRPRQGPLLFAVLRFPGPAGTDLRTLRLQFHGGSRRGRQGLGSYCSNACRRSGAEVPCVVCGKLVWRIRAELANRVNVHCSKECRGITRRNRATYTCKNCNKVVETSVSVAETRLYCSRACWVEAWKDDPLVAERTRSMQRNFLSTRPTTRCEGVLYGLLDEVLTPDSWSSQHLLFNRWTVDAAVPALQIILQADGDYWHGRHRTDQNDPLVRINRANDRAVNAYAAAAGWTMVRFWEGDLLHEVDRCRSRLRSVLAQRVEAAVAEER